MTSDPERALDSLEGIVQREARRVLSETQLAPDPKRVAEGWERRFIADRQRAAEAIALYEELGFEVVADPLKREDLGDDCDDCQLAALLGFTTIYTRRRPDAAPHKETGA